MEEDGEELSALNPKKNPVVKKTEDDSTKTKTKTKTETEFYLRYYVGHFSKDFGHEYLEFSIEKSGKLKYTNSSNYRREEKIEKEVDLNEIVVSEFQKFVKDSKIMGYDDSKWERPQKYGGRQELEIDYQGKHKFYETVKIGSILDVTSSKDVVGMKSFYSLVQDLKCFVISLITIHFKIKPI